MNDRFVGPFFSQSGSIGPLFAYGSENSEFELDLPYAIVDLETSGLSANNSRVIEVAIIRMNPDGRIQDEFSTLIDPEDGNVGKTSVHCITSSMIQDAPTFREVCGQIVERLSNVIVVAHNAKFEENFLYAEFKRSQVEVLPLPALDTLQLAPRILNLRNYRMDDLMAHYGVRIQDQHTALGDVRAIGKFLPQMVRAAGKIKYPVGQSQIPGISSTAKLKPRTAY